MNFRLYLLIVFVCLGLHLHAEVKLGIEVLFEEGHAQLLLKDKRIGLISNQTAINRKCETTMEIIGKRYALKAVFAPEHGFFGDGYAYEEIKDHTIGSVPIYSLHGETRRPTAAMLANIDVLIFDIQDIGSRSYTFISTLCYCMEEAAKHKIKFIVLDRPNPLGGEIVDGALLDENTRSFLGYLNVPYCHGMTVGELATFFNEEYKVGCDLKVIPMKGWKRGMSFADTKLLWSPTSPQIPEADTPFYYPTTGLIGHCSILSIGIGYTLPFKVVGAPWVNAEVFAEHLNAQKLPGVFFQPFYYRPFFGKYKLEDCQGVRIVILDPHTYLPVTTQYMIMGIIKTLYPSKFEEALNHLVKSNSRRDNFNKLNGSEEILRLITQEKYFIWKIREKFQKDRETFLGLRKKYLIPSYS